MSDLIDRQAAIDAMSESLKRVFPEHRQIAEKCLNVLPAVQPQTEEDCDTCKHGYFGDRQCDNCRVRYPSHYEREEERHGSD